MKKYFFLILILNSCGKNNDFEDNLIREDKKWLYISSSINIDSLDYKIPLYYIRFTKDFKWRNYFIENDSKSFTSNNEDWSFFDNDSVLVLGTEKEMKFKIYKYTKDTIYMQNYRGLKEYLINYYGPSPSSAKSE